MSNYEKFMLIALNLAKRHLGLTAPNPSVGCVLVKDEQIIATGVTAVGGRPHAEAIALSKAGKNASDATAYVTLEPCSHYGETPPCADRLIEAGVTKVVVATKDSYAKVDGSGIKKLQESGVEVVVGICENEARKLNEGFSSVHEKGRPYVTLKLATSSNGKIADKNGNSKWITGEDTRAYAHYIRAKNDAILVGVGTVLKDDPMLNCRLNGLEDQSPVRVVLDSYLRTPINSQIVQTANYIPTYIICSNVAKNEKLEQSEVKILKCRNEVEISEILKMLAKLGITRLMVEGGSKVAASFIKGGFVDELIWMKANKKIDDDGISAIDQIDIKNVVKNSFEKVKTSIFDNDEITFYKVI